MENMDLEALLDSIKNLLEQNRYVIEAQINDFKKESKMHMEQLHNGIKDIKVQLTEQKSQTTELQNRQRNGLKSNSNLIKER